MQNVYVDIIVVIYLYIWLDKGKFFYKDDFKFQFFFVLFMDVLEILY